MKRVSLFPNYLFSRFPPAISKQVAYTLGVARILRRGNGEYAEVPAEVMRELIQLAPNAILRLDDPDFQIGQHIKIIRGAFDGMEGSITRLAPAKRRVAVLLSFLGQELPVEIPIDQIDIPENNPRHRLIHKQMAGPGQG
jgi:transcription antitermination factor NusG